MPRDPRVDAYIARQGAFAQPILARVRELVHDACPECEETLKWSSPAFMYKGAILAHMAAFKAHAAFGFWQGDAVTGTSAAAREAMGSFGRLTSLDDLPDAATLKSLVRKAMGLIDAGEKRRTPKHRRPPLDPPQDLLEALAANPAAQATFERLNPSCRRDYVQWVVEAKRPETRRRRIAQAVAWMAEGKTHDWRYQKAS
jgi:uncharacterized protein YdeI (YjbR/CyaY-like superfamily)